MKYDVFISYSSKDQKIVEALCAYLEQHKIRCFVAYRDIAIGSSYPDEIVKALKNSHIMIAVSSKSYNASEQTDREVKIAKDDQRIPIIPFRLSDDAYNDYKHYFLSDCHWLDAFPDPEKSFGKITSVINILLLELDKKNLDDKESVDYVIPLDDVKKETTNPDNLIESKRYDINGVEFKMIKVEGGTFNMGCENSNYDESPVHEVTLSDYYIAETPVTQELWKVVMGNNPSYFKNDKFPVESVSWNDTQIFISQLNSMIASQFRLLTEAEWEYAARGGKYNRNSYKYSGSNDINQVAWWNGNSDSTTHAVKTKCQNELGIYDMSGNVWEWCNDYKDDYKNESSFNPQGPQNGRLKVQRGGCWDRNGFDTDKSCEVTYRSSDTLSYSSKRIGFRLAMSLSDSQTEKELPKVLKLSLIGRDFYMFLSTNKEFYIGNVLDKDGQFSWLNANSRINADNAILTGAVISFAIINPILTLLGSFLYTLFKSDKKDDFIVDENFCKAITGDYKFSVPNADELKEVIDSEQSHCVVLRLKDNPRLNDV